jgi:hypothetical protein
MTKVAFAMLSLTFLAKLLAAQTVDVKSLLGKSWYGLYLSGMKVGYAMSDISIDAQGNSVFKTEAHFRITMATIRQDMSMSSTRVYGPAGDLATIESRIKDLSANETRLTAKVQGNELLLHSEVGGVVTEKSFPKPAESIKDALKELELSRPGAKIGDRVTYSTFEPEYQMTINCASQITAIEERILDGVKSKVYKIETRVDPLGIHSVSYTTEGGDLLEAVTAGVLTMRVEPEKVAKDVNYVNDVVVSNAAMVDKPIEQARTRESLTLRLSGPLGADHIFNDDRQQLVLNDKGATFTAKRIDVSALKPVTLPVHVPAVEEWTKPSLYIQSDNPKLVAKAREIVGDEINVLKASEKLCHWVYTNMRSTYSAQLANTVDVFERLEGDCTEHSVLFIGLARAVGIPAREVAGLIYVDNPSPGFFFHQWAKVWAGTWIDVDPTFDQPLADVTHIKLVEGDLVTQVRILPLIGKLKVEVAAIPAGTTGVQ